jgi:hypothetical protein
MASIGEPIRRHEVIPLENEPIQTPDGPKAPPVTEPSEPVKTPERVPV